jgi:hypothetical protein
MNNITTNDFKIIDEFFCIENGIPEGKGIKPLLTFFLSKYKKTKKVKE